MIQQTTKWGLQSSLSENCCVLKRGNSKTSVTCKDCYEFSNKLKLMK
jgi:hypothetical protein